MDKPRVHAPFSVLTIIEEEPTQTVATFGRRTAARGTCASICAAAADCAGG